MRNSKMRVAVCISGHLRTLEAGLANFQQRIVKVNSQYEFDYFIDTWMHGDYRGGENRNTGLLDINTVFEKFSDAKAICFEVDHQWDTSRFLRYIQPGYVKKGTAGEHILGMYYKIFGCDLMLQKYELTGVNYDVVIRWRTDIAFDKDIILDDYDMSKVNIPQTNVVSEEWVTDIFAFSSAVNMHKYARLFMVMDERVRSLGMFRPEPLLCYHLVCEGLEIERIPIPWRLL